MGTRFGDRRASRSSGSTVSAYKVPTDAPESDGTYRLGHDHAGPRRGHGRRHDRASATTYADTATARARPRPARPRSSRAATRWRVPGAWSAMVAAIRNLGRPGIASMAISAVDAALWDLKAPAAGPAAGHAARGGPRRGARSTAAAGSRRTRSSSSQTQLGGWVAAGHPAGEDEDRPRSRRRPRPRPGRPRGDRARRRAVRRRQRRLQPQAGPGPGRAVRRAGRDLVRGAGLLRRPRRAAAAPRPGARPAWRSPPGEYGYDLSYFRRMLEAGAVDVLQADATRCGGITGFLRVGALCEAPVAAALGPLRPVAARPPGLRAAELPPPRILPRPRPDRAHALRRCPDAGRAARCGPTCPGPAWASNSSARTPPASPSEDLQNRRKDDDR